MSPASEKPLEPLPEVTVAGAGAFGTALAVALSARPVAHPVAHPVALWTRDAAAAAGVPKEEVPAGMSRGKETFFDGVVFDPADPARYLSDLKIKSIRV